MIRLKRLAFESVPWAECDSLDDRTIYQTRPWLEFLDATQGGEPVVAAILSNDALLGYFTGMIVRRCGVRIFGSPFRGWTTGHMGCNLVGECDSRVLLSAIRTFVFDELRCHYLEIFDRRIGVAECADLPFRIEYDRSFAIDLRKSDEEILGAMNSSCRRYSKSGRKVVIEEADDLGFADEYYDQLMDVFFKQDKVPTYKRERVRELIRHLQPTGSLLLLRARTLGGECAATGIFVHFNDCAYFWGGASWRCHQDLRPNEPLMWYALKYYKKRGVSWFDFGGGGEYKKKFGGRQVPRHYLCSARYPLLLNLRDAAKRFWHFRQDCIRFFSR